MVIFMLCVLPHKNFLIKSQNIRITKKNQNYPPNIPLKVSGVGKGIFFPQPNSEFKEELLGRKEGKRH